MRRRRFLELGAAVPLIPLVGCGGDEGAGPTPGTAIPTGLDLPELTRLQSTSGDPRVLAATLTLGPTKKEFIPGVPTDAITYNGITPGPLIDIMEGDTVSILLVNNLTQETTVHWHGLPIPPAVDGLPMDPIPPGTSFLYQFTLPPGSAATYWYHPHPHLFSAEQVFRGAAGLFIVRDPRDPIHPQIEEKNLFITDLRLNSDGQIPENSSDDFLNGREGNHLLVNGRENPKLSIRPGTTQRWRVANATNSRYLRLHLTGHLLNWIGTDGGLFRAPLPKEEILLAPAERIEVLVTAIHPPGTVATLLTLPYDRKRFGPISGPSPQFPVLTLAYTNDSPVAETPLPAVLRPITKFGIPAERKQVFFQAESAPNGTITFLVNGKVFDGARVDLRSFINTLEEWEVTNLAGLDHPFHIHQGQFQIVSITEPDGTTHPPEVLAWKDSFLIRAGQTVRFRMIFPRRGKNVFHCHILEHETTTMMGVHEII